MRPTLTIFTPAYNRADCLPKGYEALCRQTLKDFIWIIVDDGSTDNTKDLVRTWQKQENGFKIRYIYKPNGGMYTGYNTAIAQADTDLCMCVDSDDYLTDDAVEKIIRCWKDYGGEQYAGIVGLDCFEDGQIIGDKLPDHKSINLLALEFGRYHIHNGDRKNIFRTDLYKSVTPMKEYPEERDFNPHYIHLEISEKYDCLVLNEKLCCVERRSDGMHTTVFRQYLRSPKSFRAMRLRALSFKNSPLTYRIRHTLHYISSCLISHEPCISASPRKLLTVLLYPMGILFYLYVMHCNRKNRNI